MANDKPISNDGKGNVFVKIRVTESQNKRLRFLAEDSGFNTVSAYIRSQCLNPSMEVKLNQIIKMLKEKEGEKDEKK